MNNHHYNACDKFKSIQQDGHVDTGHPEVPVNPEVLSYLRKQAREAGLRPGDYFTITIIPGPEDEFSVWRRDKK